MRHMKAGKKLNRSTSHRRAMFRNIVTSLLQYERIVTTNAKSKEVGRLTEKMITLGKRGDLHARRQAISFIKSNEVVKKLFSVLAERYRDRDGGYTRVLKLEPRSGDNAPMAMVELVDRPIEAKQEKESKTKKKETKAKTPRKTAAKKGSSEKKADQKTKDKPAKKDKETAKKAQKAKDEKSAEVKPAGKKTARKVTAKKETAKKETGKKTATEKKKDKEPKDKS